MSDPDVLFNDSPVMPLEYEDEDTCGCGLVGELNWAGECSICAAAPHDRECSCDECEEYWRPFVEVGRAS